ncbi:UDP-N-acetylglucosamine-transferase [Burkholderia sp. JSH-S8]|nr:UDP-N-acetylglucosamine-transferase [Burkholderia sp. JSH-S8]
MPLDHDLRNAAIFVQIASYRDAQLTPTLVDLIEKSRHPTRLRIVVCWQHAPDEALAEFWRVGFGKWRLEKCGDWAVHYLDYAGASVELIDVSYLQTRGACWARNLIQQRYRGERYTLQLDSHHRFIDGWDTLAIDMLESLRDESPKPVLTAYLPMYDPEDPKVQAGSEPQIMTYFRFSDVGVLMFQAKRLDDWQALRRPVRARFYSGHFTFADGHFAEAVRHDPEYFFLGEEISIAVRAFTHGYDLYHPHRLIAWHEYTRRHRVKMWDDHNGDAKARGKISRDWVDLNSAAFQRNRTLFGIDGAAPPDDRFGEYGFGTARTVDEYEAYAGISFRHRGIQRATLDHLPPTPGAQRPASDKAWRATLVRANDVRICVHQDEFDRHAPLEADRPVLARASVARIAIQDADASVLHRDALDAERLARYCKDGWLDFHAVFESGLERSPSLYVVELLDDDAGHLLVEVRYPIV